MRINTIESTSPLATSEDIDQASLPPVMVPSKPPSPDKAVEQGEVKSRVRAAIKSLPPRERKVIGLYYSGEVTMKRIGTEIGVNESRVSQLHTRAINKLRKALAQEFESDAAAANALGAVLVQNMMPKRAPRASRSAPRGVVLPYPKRRSPKANQLIEHRPRAGTTSPPTAVAR